MLFRSRRAGSLQSWDRRVRPRLVWSNGTPLASRVVHGMTGHLSSCMWNLRFWGTMHRGVSAPFVVPSSTGLSSKRCLVIGFFSRVYWEIGVFQHVAPPTRPRLEISHESGFILRCAVNVGNPFKSKQGNRPSCRYQEGRRGSKEVVPGTSVFPSNETGVSGNIWGRIKGAK